MGVQDRDWMNDETLRRMGISSAKETKPYKRFTTDEERAAYASILRVDPGADVGSDDAIGWVKLAVISSAAAAVALLVVLAVKWFRG